VKTVRKWSKVVRAHQRWLNFVGSLFGWAALGLLGWNVGIAIAQGHKWEVTVWELLLAAAAFLGITGHLPYAAQVVREHLNNSGKKQDPKGDQPAQ
jgi:hypothetical protein